MFRKRNLALLAIALFGLLALLALDRGAPFAYVRTRNLLRDAITRAGRTTPANPDLVFLAIDSDSVSLEAETDIQELYGLTNESAIETRALRAMSQRWPWPREVYGLILERLVGAGARAVMFDLTFPTPTAGDEPFHLALDRYREQAIIGSNFVAASARGFSSFAASHTRPTDSLVPQVSPMDDRVAYTNFWPDEDDIVRHAQYRIAFEQVQGKAPAATSERFLSLGARALTKAGLGGAIPDGVDELTFRYTAPPRQGFAPHSIFEIFVPEYWQRNYGSGEFFRGKIVVVGAEGNWQHDEHPTPFGSMPGPELHLNAINAAIHHEFIREFPPLAVAGVTILAALAALALTLSITSPWLRLLVLILLDAAYLYLALQAFNRLGVFLPLVAPLSELNFAVLLGLVCDFAWERIEKKRVRRTLERYVSSNVVREMLDQPQAFEQSLGGVIKPAVILFSDIRGYTAISAKTDPHALVAQLNEYLSAMVECVFRFGGTLDKFVGDALMAVWGNVRTEGVRNDTANAVRAALAMREELARLNESWRTRGLAELRVGVAVNQGDVIVGNIGSARRMEFTVIGDVVNVTWKMQELTKDLGAALLVSKNVASLVIEDFELQALGTANVAGRAEFEIFAVTGPIDVSAEAPARTLTRP